MSSDFFTARVLQTIHEPLTQQININLEIVFVFEQMENNITNGKLSSCILSYVFIEFKMV